MFACEFCEILKNTFFTEQLRLTASIICNKTKITAGYWKSLTVGKSGFQDG